MTTTYTKKPNVIVFFTDQQRWDSSSLHGNPLDLMPNFERIARRGTHFSHSFTCQPVCGPARSCLQTGMYATETGVYRNGLSLPEGMPTLADYFNTAGYHTGYIGKWHLGGTPFSLLREEQIPVPEARRGGYREWLGADLLEFTSDAYATRLFDTDDRLVELPGYRVDALTDAAIRFVDAHRDESFFLFLSFLEPHHQNSGDNYPAPFGYDERYRDRWTPPDLRALHGSSARHLPGYWGMIKRLDEALGRLMEALYSRTLLDDTIIVFTSDHGNHFKTRNGEYKRSCHESSLRVPTAVQGPGFDGGGTVDSLVSIVDLPPTLLDAAGIEQERPMQGESLMPLVRGDSVHLRDEIFAQISESEVGRVIRTERWKYCAVNSDVDPRGASYADSYTETNLYDLESDPYELDNLVGMDAFEEVSRELRARLTAAIARVERRECRIVPAPSKPTPGQRIVQRATL